MKVKVSIIVPVYNAEKTIFKCINSLTEQEFDDIYEIIIVDNGSTDRTINILNSFANKKIKIASESERGPAAARNKGISLAKGEYIAFTDSDCEVHRNWLSTLLNTIEKTGADVVGGGVYCPFKNIVSIAAEISLFGEFTASEDNVSRYTRLIPTNNVCYKKEIFDKLGVFDVRFKYAGGEDALFNWIIYKNNFKIFYNNGIRIIHHHRSDLSGFLKKKLVYGRGFYLSRKLDPSMPYSYLIRSLFFLPFVFIGKIYKDINRLIKNNYKNGFNIVPLVCLLILGNIFYMVGILKERIEMRL